MINTISEFESKKNLNFHHFSFYEQLKFHAQLTVAEQTSLHIA